MRSSGGVDVVPELKLLIGEQPPVVELPPQQAQSRLNTCSDDFSAFSRGPNIRWRSFLTICDGSMRPRSTYSAACCPGGRPSSLLVIGAYRDNEVDSAIR